MGPRRLERENFRRDGFPVVRYLYCQLPAYNEILHTGDTRYVTTKKHGVLQGTVLCLTFHCQGLFHKYGWFGMVTSGSRVEIFIKINGRKKKGNKCLHGHARHFLGKNKK